MFKAWCASQKFNNATNLSHVLMDGGVLSVPFDKLNVFYEQYVDAVKRGERLYVVEQKSDTYNFFVDIDYKDEKTWWKRVSHFDLTTERIWYTRKDWCTSELARFRS
jgi:hypothetical protein